MVGDVPPAKQHREQSSAAAGSNADAISLYKVSVEQQVLNYF